MNNTANLLENAFSPYGDLVATVLALSGAGQGTDDGSHDLSHIIRVWKLVKNIATQEGPADLQILAVATLMHDCVHVEKSDPRRAQASRLSADRASAVLRNMGWSTTQIDATAHVIEAHSFSANIAPRTLEARILRDADRLDAIGAIGVARTFYVAGRIGSNLYNVFEPVVTSRTPDDRSFALDHFELKLFRLVDGLETKAARVIAEKRLSVMRRFVEDLVEEIQLT